MPVQASSFPVLNAMCAHAGGDQDREYGGLLSIWAERVAGSGVRRIRLRDGVVRHADAELPTTAPVQPTYVEWSGANALLIANDSVPCAAIVSPISEGYFSGAVSVRFIGAPAGGLLPFPGAVVVDLQAAGEQFSRIDQMRIWAGQEPAGEMNKRALMRADLRAMRIGRYWVRAEKGKLPTHPSGGLKEVAWRTWIGHGLDRALAATCVEVDADNPMFAADRTDDVREWAHRLFGFALWAGPAAALKLLNLLNIQTRRMN